MVSASLTYNKKMKDATPIAKIKSKNELNNNVVLVSFEIDKPDRVYSAKLEGSSNFIPIPYKENNQRSAIYISGCSGSGKSTFAKNMILELWDIMPKQTILKDDRKVKKNCPVFYFSAKDNDKSLDDIRTDEDVFFKVDIESDEFLGLSWNDIENDCICLFDDWNIIKKKKFHYLHIINLVKELLELSRSKNIQIIIINHQTMDYHKTRDIIFECDSYVIFPESNPNACQKFLKNYGSLSNSEIDHIMKQDNGKFSFCYFHKSLPRYIISNKEIKLL